MTNLVRDLRKYACGLEDTERGTLCIKAADEIDRLQADISQAYDLRDKAEGRYCTALGEIERLNRKCSALAFLHYGSRGPDDPWQAKLDEVTKPLHAEIERLQRESAWQSKEIDAQAQEIQRLRGHEPSVVHADPTGKTREPPHCPTCECGMCGCPDEYCLKRAGTLKPGIWCADDCTERVNAITSGPHALTGHTEPTAQAHAIVRSGECPNCQRKWEVKASPGAEISVLAFHCSCGHDTK